MEKTKGCKWHIVVDIMGNPFFIKVHASNIHDTASGVVVYAEALESTQLSKVFARMHDIARPLRMR